MMYRIEDMEHGAWLSEAPDAYMAVVSSLQEGDTMRHDFGKFYAIYDSEGELVEHWMVTPVDDEDSNE